MYTDLSTNCLRGMIVLENDFLNQFLSGIFFSFSSNLKIILQNYHPPLTVSMKTRKHFEVSEYTTRTGYSKTISTYSSVSV